MPIDIEIAGAPFPRATSIPCSWKFRSVSEDEELPGDQIVSYANLGINPIIKWTLGSRWICYGLRIVVA